MGSSVVVAQSCKTQFHINAEIILTEILVLTLSIRKYNDGARSEEP